MEAQRFMKNLHLVNTLVMTVGGGLHSYSFALVQFFFFYLLIVLTSQMSHFPPPVFLPSSLWLRNASPALSPHRENGEILLSTVKDKVILMKAL